MRSNQKAGIENVHTMLRMILPKGTVFTDLTQWDIRKKKLQLRYVAPDEVTLTPKLLSK